jgi:hypothetical protein
VTVALARVVQAASLAAVEAEAWPATMAVLREATAEQVQVAGPIVTPPESGTVEVPGSGTVEVPGSGTVEVPEWAARMVGGTLDKRALSIRAVT